MAYKALRNKVLKDAPRLIRATYHGAPWCAPSGYFAVSTDIYSDYKPRPYNERFTMGPYPKLDDLIDTRSNANKYVPVIRQGNSQDDDSTVLVLLGTREAVVNTLYLEFIVALYPGAMLEGSEDDKYAPIKVYKDNTLVAAIMPLKR